MPKKSLKHRSFRETGSKGGLEPNAWRFIVQLRILVCLLRLLLF